jgi:hypothetical protein
VLSKNGLRIIDGRRLVEVLISKNVYQSQMPMRHTHLSPICDSTDQGCDTDFEIMLKYVVICLVKKCYVNEWKEMNIVIPRKSHIH